MNFCSDIFQVKAAENGVEKKASDSEVVKISVLGVVQAVVARKPWFFLMLFMVTSSIESALLEAILGF